MKATSDFKAVFNFFGNKKNWWRPIFARHSCQFPQK